MQRKELREWAKKFHEYNEFYTLYGFDLRTCVNPEDFLDYFTFMRTRNFINRIGAPDCQIVLLRDKYLFYKYMVGCGMPVPEVFGIISNGICLNSDCSEVEESVFSDKLDFFLKEAEGECASFVKRIGCWKELGEYRNILLTGRFILQKRIFQSKEMNAIYPNPINTYRIVTINQNGEPKVFSALLRLGTSISGNVDNWAAGGLAVGINSETGFLKKYGFYKPKFGTKTAKHPDTGVVFEETMAPQFEQAKSLALRAAKCFYGIKSIGWDIAITDEGPVIIEGNDNWEISL